MNYGLYSAFLGMRARQRTLETIANNIANASTAGFKADRLFHHSIEKAETVIFDAQLRGVDITPEQAAQTAASQSDGIITFGNAPLSPNTSDSFYGDQNPPDRVARVFGILSGGATDFSAGVLRETGRALDVALDGEGFFVVQTPRGERYTRAGNLTVDAAGQIVTQRGEIVVSDKGPITVARGKGELTIGADGSVSVGTQQLGKLKVVRFDNIRNALQKEGDSLFVATGKEKPQDANTTRVVQGVLELSNVNAVSEMATMLHNSREFDSLQRSITLMMNDIGRKVATEVGRI